MGTTPLERPKSKLNGWDKFCSIVSQTLTANEPSRVDLRVELRVGEGGIVQLVVAPAPEAVELHEHVLPELAPVLKGQPGRPDYVFRVVTVGV